MNLTLEVEGHSAADPVLDEDWADEVRWTVNQHWMEKTFHDRNGYIAEIAESPACLALGHIEPESGWEEAGDPQHPYGWEGFILCNSIRLGDACTSCEREAELCDWQPADPRAFWRLFSAEARA